VAGLENLPSASLAQAIEDDVRSQRQVLAISLEQLVDLERRQPVAAQQLLTKGACVLELGRRSSVYFLKLQGRE